MGGKNLPEYKVAHVEEKERRLVIKEKVHAHFSINLSCVPVLVIVRVTDTIIVTEIVAKHLIYVVTR